MCQGIEDLDVARIEALNQIQEGKRAVARAYNKKVKLKSFGEGDLVWKAISPLGAQVRGFGKWSPTWEGPFIIHQALNKGGYYLADLEGIPQKHPVNAKFLKKISSYIMGCQGLLHRRRRDVKASFILHHNSRKHKVETIKNLIHFNKF